MPLDQVSRLAELERCVALKWSWPTGGYRCVQAVSVFADRLAVFDNQGLSVLTHFLGGAGFITHLATVWPEHELAVWKLLEAGNYSAAQKKITAVRWPWVDFRVKMLRYTGAESPTVRAALGLCSRRVGPSRPPYQQLPPQACQELHRLLNRIGVPDVQLSPPGR